MQQCFLVCPGLKSAVNNLYPSYLNTIFEQTSQIHSHNLRGSSNRIFNPRTDAGNMSFSYRGAVLWNDLPDDLKNSIPQYNILKMLCTLIKFDSI
jgi:hypothetical protein